MSQDNYFAKRHRAEGSAPLSQIDLNQLQNVSHIPQLSSTLKRSSARQSIIGAPRTKNGSSKRTSAPGLSEMVQQSALRSNKRKSLAGANSVTRPTNRASSFGLGGLTLSQTKDPRPLRDRNYQQTIQQDIFDFLVSHNFETEMKHPLTAKTLRNPTQKDFVMIFQFLYKKVDPGYRFTKSIEHEVYYVLRNIKYPYLDSINKSQISAVGGQNWPVFLGILHWLVGLVEKVVQMTAVDQYPDDFEGAETDELELERIFVNYIVKSYNAFLNNIDDYSVFYDEMKTDYETYTKDMVEQTEEVEKENDDLRKSYQKLLVESESLDAVEKKFEALESDLFKFKAYIESMESRKLKWNTVLEQIKIEMTKSEAELARTEEEKSQIQKQISDQGLTPKDIDRMNSERDRVSKAIDAVNLRLNEISKIVHAKEIEAQHSYEDLANNVKEYNFNIYNIASTSPDIDPSQYIIKLDSHLSEERLGLRPDALLEGQDLKTNIRLKLQKLKSDIGSRIHHSQDEAINLQERLDSLSETINERSENIESLEARLSALKLDYEELYETMTKDASSYHAEIERFENELKLMQSNSKQNQMLLEQHTKTVNMQYKKLVNDIQQERGALHSQARDMMDIVITLKMNIQTQLYELESMVEEELEKQKAEQAVQ
jgi:kinetochore protein NDC80